MSVAFDFDFAKWIAIRRGSMEQSAREGAAYAFSGELKFRRTLMMARPVTMALEATTRLWRDVARTELLGTAVKVSDQQYPRVFEAAKAAGMADVSWDPDAPMDDGNPLGMPEEEIHLQVDVSAHLHQRRSALRAHASQATDIGAFLGMPDDVFEMFFGAEHYIERGREPGMRRGWFFED